jgi:hypothetical protein
MMAAPTSQNQDPPSVPLHTLSLHAQWAALSIRDALAKFQNEAGIVVCTQSKAQMPKLSIAAHQRRE